jgi:hypothetical protein
LMHLLTLLIWVLKKEAQCHAWNSLWLRIKGFWTCGSKISDLFFEEGFIKVTGKGTSNVLFQ